MWNRDIDQFASDVFFWFKLSAACQEDYVEVQIAEFMDEAGQYIWRPVASRWLSLGPVCGHLLEQYPAIVTYCLKAVPNSPNSIATCSRDRYRRLKAARENESTFVYLKLCGIMAFIACSLSEFLKLSQTTIHRS